MICLHILNKINKIILIFICSEHVKGNRHFIVKQRYRENILPVSKYKLVASGNSMLFYILYLNVVNKRPYSLVSATTCCI